MHDGKLLGRVIDTFVTRQLRGELEVSPARPRLYHHVRTFLYDPGCLYFRFAQRARGPWLHPLVLRRYGV